MRVGLVLAAGGPVAHAYHCGVLRALQDVTGWDPRRAEVVVGTSAGAQVAALVRAGMSATDLYARAVGESLSDEGAALAHHYVRPDHDLPAAAHRRRYRPAAPDALRGRPPWRWHLGHVVAALLPEGRVDLEPQAAGFRVLFGEGWPVAQLWIPALGLGSGARVAFGAPGSPPTDVGTAVIASGSVPGLCRPVPVDGDRYVDGSCVSLTNLDLLAARGLDLVVVSSALSAEDLPLVHPHRPMRAPLRWLLRREQRIVEESGTPVEVHEPARHELGVHGVNPMPLHKMAPVAVSAYHATVARLERRPSALSG